MTGEVIKALHIKSSRKYIDATLGTGGHTEAISQKGGKVLGIEADPEMLRIAKERIGDKAKLVLGNFVQIDKISKENNWKPVSGILFDLGVSNVHLKDLERGFSFENAEASLDMRLDPENQGVTGADLLNVLREDQLKEMFEVALDPGPAKWIAGRVIHSRAAKPIVTVGDLLEISEGLKTGRHGLNEATLPFLAVRIAVNGELANLREALPKAFTLLKPGGRLVVISFHSGEDRIVKNFGKTLPAQTSKLVWPGEEEVKRNPRARSAKMRIIQK